MSTTYVVGAGASKAVWGFPVMNGFLQINYGALSVLEGLLEAVLAPQPSSTNICFSI